MGHRRGAWRHGRPPAAIGRGIQGEHRIPVSQLPETVSHPRPTLPSNCSDRSLIVGVPAAVAILFAALLLVGCRGGQARSEFRLPDLALAPVDLPGFSLEKEGYVDLGQGALATYDRVFSATNEGTIGRSQLFYLGNHVDLFPTVRQAGDYIRALEFAMEDSSELLAGGLADATGGTHEMVESRLLRLPDLGDAAVGIWLAFESGAGVHETSYIVAQVGRGTTGLMVGAHEGRLEVDDLIVLVETMVERLRSRFPEPSPAPSVVS